MSLFLSFDGLLSRFLGHQREHPQRAAVLAFLVSPLALATRVVLRGTLHRVKNPETQIKYRSVHAPCNNTPLGPLWVQNPGFPRNPSLASLPLLSDGKGPLLPSGRTYPPPPLSRLRKSPKLMRSLRLRSITQGRSLRVPHTTTNTHMSDKKGEYNAQISPKSGLCGFKCLPIREKCVHDSMELANS